MKGIHHIIVSNGNLKYEFDIKRNITILKGDSATGKTTLIEMIQEYLNHNPMDILQCFEVGKIPSYRRRFAYSDLTMTTMEDIRNGNVKKDERKATFPGIQFRS